MEVLYGEEFRGARSPWRRGGQKFRVRGLMAVARCEEKEVANLGHPQII